jgi:hypothetical protein
MLIQLFVGAARKCDELSHAQSRRMILDIGMYARVLECGNS